MNVYRHRFAFGEMEPTLENVYNVVFNIIPDLVHDCQTGQYKQDEREWTVLQALHELFRARDLFRDSRSVQCSRLPRSLVDEATWVPVFDAHEYNNMLIARFRRHRLPALLRFWERMLHTNLNTYRCILVGDLCTFYEPVKDYTEFQLDRCCSRDFTTRFRKSKVCAKHARWLKEAEAVGDQYLTPDCLNLMLSYLLVK